MCKLGSMIVSEYSDFYTLSSWAQMDELEYITVSFYKRGFSKPVCDIMRPLWMLSRLLLILHLPFASNHAQPLQLFTKTVAPMPNSATSSVPPRPTKAPPSFASQCFNCQHYGHIGVRSILKENSIAGGRVSRGWTDRSKEDCLRFYRTCALFWALDWSTLWLRRWLLWTSTPFTRHIRFSSGELLESRESDVKSCDVNQGS